MNNEYKGVLEKFGFDINTKGAILFLDLVVEIKELFKEGKTEEEIRKVLPSYYLEHYHFIHEIGRDKYFKELRSFCDNRKISEKQTELNGKEFGSLPKIGLDDSIIFFSRYFSNLEKKEFEGQKLFVKTSNSSVIKKV